MSLDVNHVNNGVVLSKGPTARLKATARGAAGSILAVATAGAEPAFTTTPTIAGNVNIDGNVDIDGNLDVSGTTILTGAVTIDGNVDIDANFDVTGTTNLTGAVTIDGGTVGIEGDLGINGNILIDDGELRITPVSGDSTAIILLPNTGDTLTGRIQFRELSSNGTDRVAVQAPSSIPSSWVFTWPAAPPTVDSSALVATTGGTASWLPITAIMQFSSNSVAAGATSFLGHGGSATEADVHFRVPVTGTISQVNIDVNAAPGGTETFTYRVRHNGSNVGTVMTITGSATSLSQSQAVAITTGDILSFRVVVSASGAVANHKLTCAIQVTG